MRRWIFFVLVLVLPATSYSYEFNFWWPWIRRNIYTNQTLASNAYVVATNAHFYATNSWNWIEANSNVVEYVKAHSNEWDDAYLWVSTYSNDFYDLTNRVSFLEDQTSRWNEAWWWVSFNSNSFDYMESRTSFWDQAYWWVAMYSNYATTGWVQQILPGPGIHVDPTNGMGVVTISTDPTIGSMRLTNVVVVPIAAKYTDYLVESGWAEGDVLTNTVFVTNRLVYVGEDPVKLTLHANPSVEPDTGSNQDIKVSFGTNGVPIQASAMGSTIDSGNPAIMTMLWVAELNQYDYVQLFVRIATPTGPAKDIRLNDCKVVIE
jgi:hypothetical protein